MNERLCSDCGIPQRWCLSVTSNPDHCWRWDYEQFDTIITRYEMALRDAAVIIERMANGASREQCDPELSRFLETYRENI